jgi:RNA polymerase sigma-70 factor (ECF subfamily)
MTGPRRDASGDRLAALYDRFAAALFRYAAMILADRAAAADAVHQVFLKLARSGLSFDDRSPALEGSYLRRAVRNECYSRLRERRRDIVVTVDANLLELVEGLDDRPAERLALEQALGELPAEQREVVHLKLWEGLTFQEIAAATGEPANTAASRYRYAIEKLRHILSEKA